ncbi:MAG TPA: hypothetical protein PLK37_05280 [Terricaulis sp.]|nr:hypothetical protein [Terricaulis sp.]
MQNKRSSAWRRATNAMHRRAQPKHHHDKREKSWKLLYLRSVKHHRAQQLGMPWPRKEWLKLMADADPLRVLFICSRNQWRSPTAERVWKAYAGVEARSAGTSKSARRRLSVADLRWADLILVMEEKHRSRIKAEYRDEVRYKSLHVLDVPDEYQFMDPDLVDILKLKVEPLIRDALQPTRNGEMGG